VNVETEISGATATPRRIGRPGVFCRVPPPSSRGCGGTVGHHWEQSV